MTEISRRHLLGLGAATAALTAGQSLLPPSFQKAMALEPAPGGLAGVKHVVVFMQENRSFDHYFGTLRGVAGFGDRTVLPRRKGGTLFEQDGVLPFLVREARDAGDKSIEYIASLPHTWPDGQEAWNAGWCDNWVKAKGRSTMAAYDRSDIPFQFELADKFTICDAYFCSMNAGTSPNRNYLVSGLSGFEPGSTQRAVMNDAYAASHAGYDWKTYTELLTEAGVSWQVMQEWDNYTDNNLEFFRHYKDIARTVLAGVEGGAFGDLTEFYNAVIAGDGARRASLLAQLDAAVATLPEGHRLDFERALRRGPEGSVGRQFRDAVASGTLPAVTHIVASAADSEHPSVSSPIQSANLTYQILEALGDHPEVWRETVFLLMFDEYDGYFDHVPQPVPPAGTADEYFEGLPVGLGPRVPMYVVSPWSVGGYVSSEVFDHTSVIRFLEEWTGVRTDQISAWRRAAVGDLTGTMDFAGTAAAAMPRTTQPGPVPAFTGRWMPTPPKEQALPVQEPGTRLARALPYRPEAHLRIEGGTVRVDLSNAGERPAHLAVYDFAGGQERPEHADVAPRSSQRFELAAGKEYSTTVTGPNRFRRDASGPLESGLPLAQVTTGLDHGRRLVTVAIFNPRAKAILLRVQSAGDAQDRTLSVSPGTTHTLIVDAGVQNGWYDVVVTAPEVPAFRFWATGHLENDQPSISSPFRL